MRRVCSNLGETESYKRDASLSLSLLAVSLVSTRSFSAAVRDDALQLESIRCGPAHHCNVFRLTGEFFKISIQFFTTIIIFPLIFFYESFFVLHKPSASAAPSCHGVQCDLSLRPLALSGTCEGVRV